MSTWIHSPTVVTPASHPPDPAVVSCCVCKRERVASVVYDSEDDQTLDSLKLESGRFATKACSLKQPKIEQNSWV